MTIALSLIGGLALFLFGLNIVGRALSSVAGGGLRKLVLSFTRNRFFSSAIGFAMAILLQSTSGMSALLIGLADSGVLHLRAAIPLLLGANIGATVTVQVIAFNLADFALLFIALGFLIHSVSRDDLTRAVGEVILGFGLVFYGMGVMSLHGREMAENPWISSFLSHLDGHPVNAVLAAIVLTAIVQAAAATIGLAITLNAMGLISIETSLYIVAGANIGTVSAAVITSLAANYKGRRVATAHVFMRLVGLALFIIFMPFFAKVSALGGAGNARTIANAHTLFAVALFAVAIPFTSQVRLFIRRLIPTRVQPAKPVLQAMYLERKFIQFPSIALNQSWKEIQRIALYLEQMMADIGQLVTQDEPGLVNRIRRHEKYIDSLVRQTVLYLGHVGHGAISDVQLKGLVEQLFLLDNLESIADTIKSMGSQSAKRIDAGITFSEEGAKELLEIHGKVTALLYRLARALKEESRDSMASIAAASLEIEHGDETLKLSHFQRLMSGKPESESSTTIHMELLNLLGQVNSRVGSIARRLSPTLPPHQVSVDDYDYTAGGD